MTILESLREKHRNAEDSNTILDVLQQYDLALENALLKLKNRGVQVSDLKNRIKELEHCKECGGTISDGLCSRCSTLH